MNIETPALSCIVVGAAGGIGRAVCEGIASAGGRAFLLGRTEETLRPLAAELGFPYSVADASNWEQLDAAVALAETELGSINAAINLAGSVLLKPAHLTSRADWDATLAANLTSAFGVLRAVTPRMFKSGGSVVLLSSAAASIGLSNHEAIAACKSGIEGMVRSAATTYASKSIRVNAIAPGLVETPMTERIWKQPRAAEASLMMHPLGRFGSPDEIARGILFLASPEQSWITGQVLGIDGGLGRLKTMNAPKPANTSMS